MTVLVLNASYEPINVCTVKRAVVLLLKEKAEVLAHGEDELRAETISLTRPAVIRLLVYVRLPYDSRRRITRRAVFARDGWKCAYCETETALTVDHVVPRSRGGKTEWENVVAACTSCNARKGNRSPREANMRLLTKPCRPDQTVFVYVAVRNIPSAWTSYLVE